MACNLNWKSTLVYFSMLLGDACHPRGRGGTSHICETIGVLLVAYLFRSGVHFTFLEVSEHGSISMPAFSEHFLSRDAW